MISDQITAAKFQQWAENEKTLFILDVRSPQEHASGHLGGHLIPLPELAKRADEIPRNNKVVIYCRSGARSQVALEFLKSLGYTQVYNLIGGILACDTAQLKFD